MKINSFNEFELNKALLKSVDLLGYKSPTAVQEQVIPAILENLDVVVKSETGSGKTAAFAIPIIEQVEWEENAPQVLVLTPTRELAHQVKDEMFNIGRFNRMKVAAIYGKTPIRSQIKELKQKTHIVVGTPGRVFDHIERGTLNLSKIKYLVLDEADEMLNMGFVEQIEDIIKCLPKKYVTTLLSATMPENISKICSRYMKDPIYVEIEDETTHTRIEQVRYNVSRREKMNLLLNVTTIENPDSCIVFCNTRLEVEEVYKTLNKWSYACQRIHGGMDQDDRTRVMKNFRKGHYRYLIATDVASRGIDIDDISLIINFDAPEEVESYVHRIGRTGRQDKMGKALLFLTPKDQYLYKSIQKVVEEEIVLEECPNNELVEAHREAFDQKNAKKPELRKEKTASLNKGILKLHINAGKKTKMRAGDIVGALCNLEGVTKDDIGNISIIDVSTFVEILHFKGESAFEQLQDTPIKGRLRKVSKANE